jgi:catechol 2,3-dioxygenase-like lactoylglutathione lyase family enzyme
MKTHISLNVHDIKRSVEFDQRVFGVAPQTQTGDYARFDLATPPLNFSLVFTTTDISRVNHFGMEAESANEFGEWERHLQDEGLVDRIEIGTDCCFAQQNKVWFTDPDGNLWEIFIVFEQLPITKSLKETGCCVASRELTVLATCGCSSTTKR